jgi:hypothetical protein
VTNRRQRRAWLVLALLTAALPGSACGRGSQSDSSLSLAWTLRPAPPIAGPATLTVTVRDRAGEPVSNATLHLEGHMSHAGMAPVLADGAQRTPGVYEVPFSFTMQGDWVLLVSATLPDGRRTERRIDVANVRPSPR